MVRKREAGTKIEVPIPTTTAAAAAAAASSSSVPPPWIELPEELTVNILKRLDTLEILQSAQFVCRTWWKVCLDPAMWRVIDLNDRYIFGVDSEFILSEAVERSKGELLDLTVVSIGDGDLLRYIARRSSHLRLLTLADCEISRKALTKAVRKLPELEELHLIMMPWLHGTDVETIGLSCPMLESFTLNHLWPSEYQLDVEFYDDECALAIGKSMPNLRHLRLIALGMENEGLEAILNGCPHLESLDIRHCFALRLQGALGNRCCEQIKDVRLPDDFISDFVCPPGGSSDDDQDGSLSSDSGDSNLHDFSGTDNKNVCDCDNEREKVRITPSCCHQCASMSWF